MALTDPTYCAAVAPEVAVTKGDDGFSVMLPNGETCTDHGIPAMGAPYEGKVFGTGIAEEDGVVFVCHGATGVDRRRLHNDNAN